MASYDVIGSEKAVAILEIPDISNKQEKSIAERIMIGNKNVKSVLVKKTVRKGKLRLSEYKLVAGDENTEVLHKEFGFILKVDPRKVYFSPREATERQRIAEQVNANEIIMVMFGGIGIMSIAIAKRQPKIAKAYSIELNPDAHKYALENIRINKLSHKIIPIEGDVRKVSKEFYNKCDRVVMPLPLSAGKFLDVVVKCLKNEGGIVHFYSLGKEDDLFSKALETIDKKLKKLKRTYTILNKRKVLPYAPRQFKICIDFMVK